MSVEAKKCGGVLPSVKEGGITASLQSIGSLGEIKTLPRENLRKALQEAGIPTVCESVIDNGAEEELMPIMLPPYWQATLQGIPAVISHDYRCGGYNYIMAEKMLSESIVPFCRANQTRCPVDEMSNFKVLKFSRLENVEAFVRYKRYESRVANSFRGQGEVFEIRNLPSWLQKLSRKNGLNPDANAVYLLHGTTKGKLECIVVEGLKTRFSLTTSGTYGKGLYFTDNSCKASQFGDIILVCRVVLGRNEVLVDACPKRLFASNGYHSAWAKKGVTPAPHGNKQLHNEYIVYDGRACYPEFVIEYNLV